MLKPINGKPTNVIKECKKCKEKPIIAKADEK